MKNFKELKYFAYLYVVYHWLTSNVIKTLTFWIDKDFTYFIKTSSKSQDVPLSNCFLAETTLAFHPYMNNNTKTVFRIYVRIHMLKYAIFKTALISQEKKSYGQEVEKWLTFIKKMAQKSKVIIFINQKKRKIHLINMDL